LASHFGLFAANKGRIGAAGGTPDDGCELASYRGRFVENKGWIGFVLQLFVFRGAPRLTHEEKHKTDKDK
jgi:hypothetical protein